MFYLGHKASYVDTWNYTTEIRPSQNRHDSRRALSTLARVARTSPRHEVQGLCLAIAPLELVHSTSQSHRASEAGLIGWTARCGGFYHRRAALASSSAGMVRASGTRMCDGVRRRRSRKRRSSCSEMRPIRGGFRGAGPCQYLHAPRGHFLVEAPQISEKKEGSRWSRTV